jgi:AcrR family transcriptional regulator
MMNTRDRLLTAAEELLGSRGIEAVPLREINRIAGQRNASALHYYYGSREALIEAVVELRMPPINARRLEMLAELSAGDVRGLVSALVRPLAETANSEPPGSHWLQFLLQLYVSNRADLGAIVRRTGHDSSLRQLIRALRAALPDIPAPILNMRFVLAVRQNVYALADWHRGVLEGQSGARMESYELFIATLVDTMVAGLTAPVSTETKRLARARRPRRAFDANVAEPDAAD